jgi:signal transduction histidine kinase
MESILERIRQDVRLARSPSMHSVDPRELLDAAVERYRNAAREQRIRLEMTSEPGLPPIRGSRDILLEALDNLIRNAFDAVPAGGSVVVSAKRLKEAIHLVVEDDGPGLTEEQISKIFEPFYTTKVRGTGLGLPLSQRLIRQCGGSLVADSRPGEGARFRIVMPAASAGSAQGRSAQGRSAQERSAQRRREEDDAQDSDR